MSPELERRLIDRWPKWFDTDGDVQRTLMPFGFQVRDGWFHLIWSLCEDLEPLVAGYERETGQSFEVLQVKEKFGGLRFYVNEGSDPIWQRIERAEMDSLRTCEVCGKLAQQNDVWTKTLCDDTPTRGHPSAYRGSNETMRKDCPERGEIKRDP
jgi:hypothetical protein